MFSRFSRKQILASSLVILAVLVIGIGGYFLFNYIQSTAPYSPVDIGYAVKTGSGASWYEIHDGRITTYPSLAGETINGVARAGGKLFVLGSSGDTSTLYSYSTTTKAYTTIYSTKQQLLSLAVDKAALYAAFTARDSASASPTVEALNLATKQLTPVAEGSNPVFLDATSGVGASAGSVTFTSSADYTALLFVQVQNVEAVTLHNGSVTIPAPAYVSTKPFSSMATIASNGNDLFAFIEPSLSIGELWQLKTPEPLTVSPQALYPKTTTNMLSITNGSLYAITLTPASSNQPASIEVSPFGSSSKDATSASVSIPLKAAGNTAPTFVGTISS